MESEYRSQQLYALRYTSFKGENVSRSPIPIHAMSRGLSLLLSFGPGSRGS